MAAWPSVEMIAVFVSVTMYQVHCIINFTLSVWLHVARLLVTKIDRLSVVNTMQLYGSQIPNQHQ